MINLFAVPASDQSIYYLGQIFGYVGTILPIPSTGAPLILGAMFKTFNSVILAVGALIVLYVTVVGVIKTAHEGEFLGRHWNQLWVPIRMVLGIAALVPTPSGYSAIQIVMMWIVVQGIGAADAVWNTVLNYVTVVGSPTTPVSIPDAGVSNDLGTLFQSLVCTETARAEYVFAPLVGTKGNYYCEKSKDNPNANSPFCQLSDDSSGVLAIQGTSQVTSAPQSSYTIQDANGNSVSVPWSTFTFAMGPNGECGSLTYCQDDGACTISNPSAAAQIRCAVCRQEKQALQSVVTVLGAIAKMFVDADHAYRDYYLNRPPEPIQMLSDYCSAQGISSKSCCLPHVPVAQEAGGETTTEQSGCGISFLPNADGSQPDATNANSTTVKQLILPYGIQNTIGHVDFIQASTDNLVSTLNNAAMNIIQQSINNNTSVNQTYTQAQSLGWIMAGAYYYTLAQVNNKNNDAAQPPATITINGAGATPISGYRNNYTAAGNLVDQLASQNRSGFSISVPPELEKLNKIGDGMAKSAQRIMNDFYKMLTGAKTGNTATNPLATLQHLGYVLLIVAQTLFALVLVVTVALAALGYLDVFVAGTGITNFVGPTLTTVGILVAPLLALFLGALFTFGAMLAVYVPLIPYIIFTMGAVSWFILVIEAMIASPLIALGILSPGGEHELLGKSSHALTYIFSLFLRPTLMIFGMMAAMLLAVVVVTMINAGFSGVMGSISHHPGLVEIILFLGAYVSMILTALNKCFALIHWVPDNVLRWIGHAAGAEAGGLAGEATTAAKEGVAARAEGMQAAGKEAKERGEVAGTAIHGYREMKKGGEGGVKTTTEESKPESTPPKKEK